VYVKHSDVFGMFHLLWCIYLNNFVVLGSTFVRGTFKSNICCCPKTNTLKTNTQEIIFSITFYIVFLPWYNAADIMYMYTVE